MVLPLWRIMKGRKRNAETFMMQMLGALCVDSDTFCSQALLFHQDLLGISYKHRNCIIAMRGGSITSRNFQERVRYNLWRHGKTMNISAVKLYIRPALHPYNHNQPLHLLCFDLPYIPWFKMKNSHCAVWHRGLIDTENQMSHWL